VEVSGARKVVANGCVDTRAEGGRVGTYLIDPTDLTIVDGAGTFDGAVGDGCVPFNCACAAGAGSLGVAAIEAASNTTNVVIEATNQIIFNNATDTICVAGGNSITFNVRPQC